MLNLEPPRKWSAAKKAAWRDLTRNLAEGLVQESDLAALEMAAVQLVVFREADEALRAEISAAVQANHPGGGYLVVVGFKENKATGQVFESWGPNPLIGIRDKAAQEYRAWCVRFGFDPSSRVGLGLGAIKARSMAADLEAKLPPRPSKNDGGP